MKRTSAAGRVVLLLFLGWLYGGDVFCWVQAQNAEVTALSELPRLWLGLLGVAVTLGGLVVLVKSRVQPPSWPPVRRFSLAALSLLFLDFAVLNSRRSGLSSEEQTLLAVQSFASEVAQQAGQQAVPRDPSLLSSSLKTLGSVPFFVDGQRVPAWKVELRERCEGPATEPGTASVGTFIYCVASDRKRAWVTLVGTPIGQVFGPRAIVSSQPAWVGEVKVAPPEVEAQPQSQPVWEQPTQAAP